MADKTFNQFESDITGISKSWQIPIKKYVGAVTSLNIKRVTLAVIESLFGEVSATANSLVRSPIASTTIDAGWLPAATNEVIGAVKIAPTGVQINDVGDKAVSCAALIDFSDNIIDPINDNLSDLNTAALRALSKNIQLVPNDTFIVDSTDGNCGMLVLGSEFTTARLLDKVRIGVAEVVTAATIIANIYKNGTLLEAVSLSLNSTGTFKTTVTSTTSSTSVTVGDILSVKLAITVGQTDYVKGATVTIEFKNVT